MSNFLGIGGHMEKALERASELGMIVGHISRKVPASLSEEYSLATVEVDPEVYYKYGDLLGAGNYLVAIDIRTLKAVGLRVVGVKRSDIASVLETLTPVTLQYDAEGLMTNAVIEAAVLLDEDGIPFTTPIEPQSPVIVPEDSGLLARVAGVPSEGVILGFLHTGSYPVAAGKVGMYLPRREFFKHLLVIGTTGSGKTTFIKNLIYSINLGWENARILIIDAAGDYTQLILPPPEQPREAEVFLRALCAGEENYPSWITVLLPLRRGDRDFEAMAEQYVKDRLAKIAEAFHGSNLVTHVRKGREFGHMNSVIVEGEVAGKKFSVEVVPLSLSYLQLRDHLEIFPLFSRQAKIYLRNILSYLEDREGGIQNFTHLHRALQDGYVDIRKLLKLHKTTIENIERAVNFIASSEEVDVMINREIVGMPPVNKLMENYKGPIILDLDYASMRGAHFIILNMIAYELMRNIYHWKKAGPGLSIPTIFVLDEAHRFFPSEGTTHEEVEIVADFLSRIARLGRSRGLGLIFSTHSPKDVHRIVIQLANTKIIFRSEREFLELLDVPKEYLRILSLAPDRVAVIRTSIIRSGYTIFKTPEALLGHYDLGRLSGTT